MIRKITILFLLFIILSCVKEDSVEYDLAPTVILISLDGFRWDYSSRVSTPNLDLLAENGVSSESYIPVFPSKTFPNHLSIVTGCYPEITVSFPIVCMMKSGMLNTILGKIANR